VIAHRENKYIARSYSYFLREMETHASMFENVSPTFDVQD